MGKILYVSNNSYNAKYNTDTLALIASGATYNNYSGIQVTDNVNFYGYSLSSTYIAKYDSDLNIVTGLTNGTAGATDAMCVDAINGQLWLSPVYGLQKRNAATMELLATYTYDGYGLFWALGEKDDYLYGFGGSWGGTMLSKVRKSDGVRVATGGTDAAGQLIAIYGIVVGDYYYTSMRNNSNTTCYVRKWGTLSSTGSTISIVATSAGYAASGTDREISTDGTYIYMAAGAYVRKYDLNLNFIGASANYGAVRGCGVEDGYIWTSSAGKLLKLDTNLNLVASASTGTLGTFLHILGYDTFNAGTIGNAQTIYYSETPSSLTTITSPTGGTGSYTYQWYSGTTTGATDVIIGATGTTYQPPTLYSDTWYRKKVTSGGLNLYSNTIKITVLPLVQLPPSFCETTSYTISGSTCGNADGKININATLPPYLSYFDVYDFTLTDIDGNSYTFNTTTGEATGLTSNYYFLTATVKPAYWYYYGRETCTFEWLEVIDSDTTMSNTSKSVRNSVCGGFGKQQGRIAYLCTDSGSNPIYTAKLYDKETRELVQTVTGTTIDLIIFSPLNAGDYYCHITNDAGCSLLIGATKVQGQSLRSVAGIKKLWLTQWDENVEYDYWAQSDDDYYLSGIDADFFNSIKIKRFIDSTLPDVWYSVNVQTKAITFSQTMEKTKQGFVFNDKLALTIPEADNTKWKELVDILQNRYILIFLDNNGYYWCMGYRHGASTDGYKRENNEYILEFNAISENKILTNIDKQYVIDSIL